MEIINPRNSRIYYASLFPLVIDDLLSRKKRVKTISAEFKLLNESDIKHIESICHEFLSQRTSI